MISRASTFISYVVLKLVIYSHSFVCEIVTSLKSLRSRQWGPLNPSPICSRCGYRLYALGYVMMINLPRRLSRCGNRLLLLHLNIYWHCTADNSVWCQHRFICTQGVSIVFENKTNPYYNVSRFPSNLRLHFLSLN